MDIKIGIPNSLFFISLLIFFVGIGFILNSRKEKASKRVACFILTEYLVLTFLSTVFLRSPKPKVIYIRNPFEWFNKPDFPIPGIYEPLLNIMLFIPIGFLIGYLINHNKLIYTVLFGFCISSIIEILQLVFSRGVVSVDDIINNTVGSLIGYILLLSIQTYSKYFFLKE